VNGESSRAPSSRRGEGDHRNDHLVSPDGRGAFFPMDDSEGESDHREGDGAGEGEDDGDGEGVLYGLHSPSVEARSPPLALSYASASPHPNHRFDYDPRIEPGIEKRHGSNSVSYGFTHDKVRRPPYEGGDVRDGAIGQEGVHYGQIGSERSGVGALPSTRDSHYSGSGRSPGTSAKQRQGDGGERGTSSDADVSQGTVDVAI